MVMTGEHCKVCVDGWGMLQVNGWRTRMVCVDGWGKLQVYMDGWEKLQVCVDD